MAKKARLEVIKTKANKDGSLDVMIDTNEEGRRLLMEAGMVSALAALVDSHIDKLSWWERFKYAWRTAK